VDAGLLWDLDVAYREGDFKLVQEKLSISRCLCIATYLLLHNVLEVLHHQCHLFLSALSHLWVQQSREFELIPVVHVVGAGSDLGETWKPGRGWLLVLEVAE